MNPVGIVDGFYAVIGASGSFFPEHVTIPVNASFYQVSEDIAASPYLVSHQLYQDLNKLFEILFKSFKIVILNYDIIIFKGIINLASLGKRGYKVPSKGTIQVVNIEYFL